MRGKRKEHAVKDSVRPPTAERSSRISERSSQTPIEGTSVRTESSALQSRPSDLPKTHKGGPQVARSTDVVTDSNNTKSMSHGKPLKLKTPSPSLATVSKLSFLFDSLLFRVAAPGSMGG